MGLVKIIAHRGASAYAPENTLAAFKLAREQGADFFELDVRQCASGELVVMHDATIDRTTSGHGRVSRLTLAQVANVGVPTLVEALQLAGPGFGCFIEVKAARARDVADSIRDSGKQKHIVVQSFSQDCCRELAKTGHGLRVELLCAARQSKRWDAALRFARRKELLGVNTSMAALTLKRLRGLHNAGLTCAVYTVDDPDGMRRAADWGVDEIVTNRPDVARQVLG